MFLERSSGKYGKGWKGLVGTPNYSPPTEQIQFLLSEAKKFLYQSEKSFFSIVKPQVIIFYQ